MNMQISYVSPPFGPAAFYLKGVTPPGISLSHIFRSIWPYLVLQLIALGLVIAFPQIALWLPSTMAGSGRWSVALDEVVDVMRVPATAIPAWRSCKVPDVPPAREIDCDVLVAGGGMGGVAAALAAARRGCRTCLLEETDWLGGQLSAQGVSALDEHEHIESFGGTASYYALREALRDHYRPRAGAAGSRPDFNPGRLLGDAPRLRADGRRRRRCSTCSRRISRAAGCTLFLRTKIVAVETEGDRIRSLVAVDLDDRPHDPRFAPAMVLDATELGDLLPLAGAEYGSAPRRSAETGEAHAQPHETKAALRAELHLRLRRRATARRRAPCHPRAGAIPALPRRATLPPDASTCTAARSTARKAAGSTTRSTTPCPAPRAGCGPIAGCSTARRSSARARRTT